MREDTAFHAVYDAPCARLGIRMHGCRLTAIEILGLHREVEDLDAPAAARVLAQLDRYFNEPRFCFSLPLEPRGTDFQRRVWEALRELHPGTVVSYGILAARLGTAARAVGNACRANPIPVVIPCHRVVGAAGPGGYMGHASRHLVTKLWLLRHEGVAFD